MAHTWTWDKLAKNAYRLNPKSRGPNYPYVPRYEYLDFTSGMNRGQKVIVPFVGTKSVLVSLKAWGVTQSALHNVTMLFSNVDIKTEDPMSRNYFQIQYDGTIYWIQKFDRFKHPLTSRCTCFTGDTEVLLGDGTYKPIRDLVGQEGFDIISYNEELDKFEKVKAYNCSLKGTNQDLIRITLDDGQTIDCTLDHRFLLRNGDWIQAQNLHEGDSLRALYYNTYANNKIKRLLPDGKKQTICEHKGKEDFYVYVYLDPRYPGEYKYQTCEFCFKPMYVGKGRRNRYKKHWQHPNRGDYFHNTLKQLKSIGLEPIILKQSINLTEHVAYKLENQLTNEIGLYAEGKGPLLNVKHDGEGGLSGIAELKVRERMTKDNPMFNPEIAKKVKLKNIENGSFERSSIEMSKNNSMYRPEVKQKYIETLRRELIKNKKQLYFNNNCVNHKVTKIERIGTGDVYCLTAEYFGNFVVKCKNGNYGIKSGIVVENCKDYFFTWAWWNHTIGHCLYGPAPRPYRRKTTTYPQRNPQHLVGICKHIYHAWGLLQNSGLTAN